MPLLSSVKKTIAANDLIGEGENILVALSGGPDSVAMLHILSRLRRSFHMNLHAVYINHQIRPRAAKTEEKFCLALCESLNIGCTIIRRDVPSEAKTAKLGLEETARNVRYQVLHELAARLGCNRIALGHHADDRVETIVFRIVRGTGRTGLGGIPIKRGKIIRPLFSVRREEIMSYLKKHNLSYCHDKSNSDSRYSRNFIRNKLLPLIRKQLNPSVDRAILDMSELMADEEAALDLMASKKAKKLLHTTPGGKIRLDLNDFGSYHLWLRRRILRLCYQMISTSGLAPDREVIERLDSLAISGGKGFSLPDKISVVRLDSEIILGRTEKQRYAEELKVGKLCRLEWPAFSFLASEQEYKREEIPRNKRAETVILDLDRLSLPLEVRNIQAGDKFKPLGNSGQKKVGDYLTDRKVPPVFREELPVVCDSDGIIWLCGYEIADRVKVSARTRRTLTIERRIRKSSKTTAL